jgi:hypothetical protein
MYATPLGFEVRFDAIEASCELVVRLAKGHLRLDAELARQICNREQEIAEFVDALSATGLERLAKFADFFVDLVDDRPGVRPIEANGRDARADLVGPQQRWERAGDASQDTSRLASVCLFAGLQLAPLIDDGTWRRDGGSGPSASWQYTPGRGEHVGMAADQLVGDGLGHVRDVEASCLGGNLRVEHALKQDVA